MTADMACLISLVLLTAIGAALRLWQIRSGLFGDELYAFSETAGASFGEVLENVSQKSIEVTPPLFFVLASAAERLGDAATTVRIPSEVAGILLIPAMFVLGKAGVDRRVGLVASALTTFSVYGIYYSVEARPYSLLMLFSAVSTICLFKLIDQGRRRWLVGYSLASAAVLYTHYSGVGVLAAQFGWAVWFHRDHWRGLVAGNLVAGLLFLVWVPSISLKEGAKATVDPFSPGVESLVSWARQLVTLPYGDAGFTDLPGIPSLVILGLCLTVGAVGTAVRQGDRAYRLRPGSTQALFPVLMLASPAFMLLASLATGLGFLQPRYFSASFPALIVTVSALLAMSDRRLGIVISGVAVAVSAFSAVKAQQPRYQRPDMRAVARWVDAPGPRNAVIADWILPYNGQNTLRPYLEVPARDRSAFPLGNGISQVENASLIGADVVLVTNAGFLRETERSITSNPRYRLKFVRTARWPGLVGGIRASWFVFTGSKPAKQ
ncbi:MAG: glycosyltransferase family 39 protein [Actinomycetes bacterium]